MKEATKTLLRERNRANPQVWKGGKHQVAAGYIKQLCHGHHRQDKQGYVYEHILVAEKCIGRELGPKECVHHINEVRNDNRPENLYLFATGGDHSAYHNFLKVGKVNRIEVSNLPIPS